MQIKKYDSPERERAVSEHFPYDLSMYRMPASDWRVALQLVKTYGYNSTSYFAPGKDKELFLASGGKALISFVEQRGCLLALGDPIGPEYILPVALEEFLRFSQERGKSVAFWQTREELLSLYRLYGLHTLKIGEDALIDLACFALKGGKMANVRTSARRAEKEQIRVLFFQKRVTDSALSDQIREISQAWLARKGGVEMGFSVGHSEMIGGEDQVIAIAVDAQDRAHAFITLVPIYRRNGWGLDLLRRSETAAPGAMELLLVRTIERLKSQNAAVISLGLAPLNNSNQDQLPLWQRCGQSLSSHSKELQHYQTLSFFKKKFHPTWENRYLIFSHRTQLLHAVLGFRRVHFARM